MAGIKETPRQRMIGMMYLVLTALLALNVSREVLQAFNNLTSGIAETVMSTEEKINRDLSTLHAQVMRMEKDSMAQVNWQKVQKAVVLSDSLYNNIEQLKKLMVEAEQNQKYDGGPESYKGSNMLVLVDEENTDVPSRILADPNNPNKAYGKRLKELVSYTNLQFINLFKDLPNMSQDELKAIEAGFSLSANDNDKNPDISKRKWEFATFNNVPLGAALAILTKMQNDLRNTESMVINRLAGEISTSSPVSGLQAMVMPRSTTVPIGSSYEADIFLGAQISSVTPVIEVDGKALELNGSTGKYKIPVSNNGKVTKPVTIKLLNPKTGITEEYSTQLSYEGFSTPAIVSAQKMNVFYKGLENPVSVSVPGFEPNKVQVSISPSGIGSVVKSRDGLYNVKITGANKRTCKINVAVKMDDGSTRTLAPQEFRIKKVPKPYANINNKSGGVISKAELPTISRVLATMDPEFLFDGVRYKITKFNYIYSSTRGNPTRGRSNSQILPDALKDKFNTAKSGDVFTIYQLFAKPVGFGEEAMLPGSLTFTVK
ncbi:MAG: GldM family protein [Bacteroidia bacterium]